MRDRRELSDQELRRIAGRKGVLAAALVGRDGLPVMSRFNRSCNEDAVAAMAAAILGAADAALLDLVGEEAEGFTVVSRGHRFSGAALGDDLMLLLITEASVVTDADAVLEEAALSLRGVLKEA